MSDKTKKTPARNTTQEEMEVDTNREGAQKAEHSGQREDQPGTSNIKRPVNAETDASSNGGTKRIRVDADDPNKVMDDQRRGRVELNKEQRDNVLRYILACHLHITSGITGVVDYNNEIYKNIHVSQQVTSIFCTIHSCLRQESLISGSLRAVMKEKDHSILVGGIEKGKLQHEVLLKVVLKIAESFGLKYIKPRPDETNHWYGTASPILCFINMFKVRMNELRVGHGSMVSKKADGNTYNISLSQYGLYNVHHPLLEGITIPPEKRSGMAQSLGPMTSLVCLARTDNDQKYSRRWRSAVKRDLAFIPEIDSIIEACCGKKAEVVKGLYSILADIILITTSRESKRASFPACMMYSMLSTHEAQHYIAYDGKYTNPTDISWFNFSGIGAGALYKMCCCMEWISPIRPESTDILPEIVFHSIWGTYGTDFGILEYMTAYSGWRDRSAIGDGFKKFGTSPPTTMRLITIHKYSKLSSANQTGLLSLSSNPIVGKSAFSGKHKQVFTDEFIDYLESSKATTSGITTNIEVLKNTLMQVKENLIAEIKANRIQSRGTTKWHSMADSTTTSYGAELDEEPTTKGKLFMQSDK